MTSTAIDDALARLAAAEEAGDHASLEELVGDDFLLVGPLGFLLDRERWLEQFRAGNLRYTRLAFSEPQVRRFGQVAVVLAVQEQEGAYRGRPVDGRFRATLIFAGGDEPRLVGMHLSPIAPPPASA